MQLIKIDQNGGLVTIEVSIDGTPTWHYYYQEDQKHEHDNSTGRPLVHTIGQPAELVKRIHVWEFRLVNVSDTSINVRVGIEWYQEKGANRTKTLIHVWGDQAQITANNGTLLGESGLIIIN